MPDRHRRAPRQFGPDRRRSPPGLAVPLITCALACAGAFLSRPPAALALSATRAARTGHPGASRVVMRNLRRPGLDRTDAVWIYRPDVPDSAALPILYYLHGHPGAPADIFHAGLKQVMDHYIARGGKPFVIAAPDGNSSLHADTEWGDSSDGSDEVESFLLRRVIPAVEGAHPRAAARRAIAGFSMGAFGAVNIGLQHPELFDQIVSIAGYFQLDDPSRMFATDGAKLANSPASHLAAARGKQILLLEDLGDPLPLIHGGSLAFKGLLESTGLAAVWHTAPGTHDLSYVIDQMPIVARFLGRGFAAAGGA